MRKYRKDMRPGEMFVMQNDSWWPDRVDVLVVLDDKKEVGFWSGVLYCFGHTSASQRFELP